MTTRFQKARFHIDSGPKSLFDRIHFKMDSVNSLNLSAKHFVERCNGRILPSEIIQKMQNFDAREWRLVVGEVRVDTGKFVNSTWEYIFGDEKYWLTIGFGNVAETIVKKESSGKDKIISSGLIYDFVDTVNEKLMTDESQKCNQ
ncbi:MAG: hypothetical protein J6W54_00745 [Fibrobacter sp.]|uniref:hypothetical protein n=1 Tax=Fibrobacter sp. TaxID=35828 RepID=UPI001B2EA7E2|nr:hypothetical protein [Fibrobacter sp.]MBO7059614.1 hypothetical protein [Fibrobacter sp.]